MMLETSEPKSVAEMMERYARIKREIFPDQRKPKTVPFIPVMERASVYLQQQCDKMRIGIATVRSNDRLPDIIEKRVALVMLVRERFPELTVTQIGELFGGRTRSCIGRILSKENKKAAYEDENLPVKRTHVLDVAREILLDYPWSLDDIRSARRHRPLVYLRQAIHVAAYEERRDMSFPQLGRQFNRDHTTILHSLNAMDKAKQEGLAEKRVTEFGREYWIRTED